MNIAQHKLYKKFLTFLTLKGVPITHVTLANGNECNGWSFLHGYYQATSQDKLFSELLSYIDNWDEQLGSLKQEHMPEVLKQSFSNGEELFFKVIDYVTFYAQYYPNLKGHNYKEFKNIEYINLEKHIQRNRPLQWEIHKMGGEKLIPIIESKGSMMADFDTLGEGITNPIILSSILNIVSSIPNTEFDFVAWCKVSSKMFAMPHIMNIHITQEGKFQFFDPNKYDPDTPEIYDDALSAALRVFNAYQEVTVNSLDTYKFCNELNCPDPETIKSNNEMFKKGITFNDLLNNGKDLSKALSEADIQIEDMLNNHYLFYRIFKEAFQKDSKEILAKCLELIQNQDLRDTLFDAAATDGQIDLLSFLQNQDKTIILRMGQKAIEDALMSSKIEVISYLQENGIILNTSSKTSEDTLLMAIKRGDIDMTSFLLNIGVDSSYKDVEGNTLLFHANSLDNDNIYRLLTDYKNTIQSQESEVLIEGYTDTMHTNSTTSNLHDYFD